jgi:coenzyme F420-reducing hydrogenase beta subunit
LPAQKQVLVAIGLFCTETFSSSSALLLKLEDSSGELSLAVCRSAISHPWSMSTILTARRQLSWPVEAGNEFNYLC